MPQKNLLAKEEIYHLAKSLITFGIEEIRLTGGEPLLRADFLDIVRLLSPLPLKSLGLTTNGVKLKKYLKDLRETNLRSINISLDSLNRETFLKMSRSDCLEQVMESIFWAKELGFKVKINTVIMKGLNDHEIEDFTKFSGKYGIEVRFLEVMKIGVMVPMFSQYFISADEMMKKISHFNPEKKIMPKDSTSFNFNLSNGAQIGFIASESKPFCGGCSRLRMGPDGKVYPCLMVDAGISLRGKNHQEIKEILTKTIGLKPTHRIERVERPMYQIGG